MGLAAEHPAGRALFGHQPQPPGAAGEDIADELLEVASRRGEGLLEGGVYLAIGLADHAAQLPQRRLEVGPPALELLDMGECLGILLLGQRVDGPELLASAAQPLHSGQQRLGLFGIERVGDGAGRRRLLGRLGLAQPLGDAPELELGIARLVAQPLCCDLRLGDELAGRAQARLDPGLLFGARAKLRGHLLARGVIAGEPLLELPHALGDRLARADEDGGEAPGRCKRRDIRGTLRTQALAPRRALGQLVRHPLSLAQLGRELALELGFPDGQRPFGRRAAALLDEPFGAPPGLPGVGVAAFGVPQRGFGADPRLLGASQLLQSALGCCTGVLLRPGRALGLRDQPLAFVAAREHALGATLGELAHLPPGREPDPARAGGRDPVEVGGQILQALDDPRVGEQPAGELQHLRRPAHEIQQPQRSVHRRAGALCISHATRLRRPELGKQRDAAVGPGGVQQRLRTLHVLDDSGIQAPAERRRERQLVSVPHPQLLAERHRATVGRCRIGPQVAAQELVGGRELGSHPRARPASVLQLALGARQSLARLRRCLLGLLASRVRLHQPRLELTRLGDLLLAGAIELGDLSLCLLLTSALDLRQLRAQGSDAILGGGVGRAPAGLVARVAQGLQLLLDPLDPPR